MTGFSPSTVTVRPAACSWLSSKCAAIQTAIPSKFNSTAAGRSCSARSFYVRTRAAAEIGSELGSAVVRAARRWRTHVGDIDGFDDLDPIAECLDLDCFHGCPLHGLDHCRDGAVRNGPARGRPVVAPSTTISVPVTYAASPDAR